MRVTFMDKNFEILLKTQTNKLISSCEISEVDWEVLFVQEEYRGAFGCSNDVRSLQLYAEKKSVIFISLKESIHSLLWLFVKETAHLFNGCKGMSNNLIGCILATITIGHDYGDEWFYEKAKKLAV
ncbi:hypothetical protein [Cellulosilyticum sp. I15G10I2]|uniref:hypothetical protein n=1 Tax=Cellulosilyticum sp. I15G10I2 TaxID=1892843 RepID=UPI00085CD27F|nr:hypothetical protein [Cellulosilyticum sp. I15G10I2]